MLAGGDAGLVGVVWIHVHGAPWGNIVCTLHTPRGDRYSQPRGGGRFEFRLGRGSVEGAIYVVQLISVRNELSTPLLAQTSHPPTRDLVCKTHAAAIARSTWRWLAHLCGRAGARALARTAAGWFGTTDAPAVALTAGDIPVRLAGRADARALQREPATRAGAESRRSRQRQARRC